MDVRYLVWFLLIGLVSGWLAGLVMKGRGFGVFGDIIVGMLGAVLGGWIFTAVGLTAYGTAGVLIMSLVGAVVLLGIVGIIKHA